MVSEQVNSIGRWKCKYV